MKIADLKPGDQVAHHRPMRSGNLVEIGNVVSLDAATNTAMVDKPQLYKMERVPLTELEKAGPTYGVPRSPSPASRTIKDFLTVRGG